MGHSIGYPDDAGCWAGNRYGQVMITVLALAGNGGNAARWGRLPRPLDSDDSNPVVLRPVLLPGFDGRKMPDLMPTVHDFAGWLAEEMRSVDGPCVVFGTGIGGSIGLQAAQEAGLVDGYIFHSLVGPNLDTRLLPKLMKPPFMRQLARYAIGGPGRYALRRKWRGVMTQADIDQFAQGYLDCEAFSVMWDILTAEWFDALAPIAEPSVLMWGGQDAVLGSNLADGFSRVLPDAEVVIEDNWGHYPMLEEPDSFASTISALSRQLVA